MSAVPEHNETQEQADRRVLYVLMGAQQEVNDLMRDVLDSERAIEVNYWMSDGRLHLDWKYAREELNELLAPVPVHPEVPGEPQ